MATIAELIAKLGLDNSQFNKKLKDSQDKLEDFGDEAEKSGKKAKDGFDGAGKGASGFGNVAKGLAPIIGAAFAADTLIQFGRNVINTTAEFQKMEAVLTNTLGSSSAAKVAMDEIVEFASKTPFAVNELTESFVKLANRGFVPTQDQMRSLGDLASSTGKSFDQLTEAALDAMTGEFERLKEFGIRASAEGDRVKFTFKGVTTEVAKTDEAIKDYLLSLGDAEGVSGSMAAISETVGGKISNLGDNFTQLYKAIGDSSSGLIAGVLDLSNALISHLAKSFDAVNTVAEKTGENGFVTFGKHMLALINPQYATQLQMQATAFKAIDKAASDAMMAGRKHFESEGEKIKELTEEQKKRQEASQKFYKSAIELSTEYNDKIKAEYSSINLITDATKKLEEASQSLAKTLTPKGIIDVGINLDEPFVSEYDKELIEQNEEAVKKYHDQLSAVNTITSMLGNTFQSAFEGMLNSGKVSFKGIIDGLKALIIKLIAAAGAALALNVLLGGIGIGGAKFGGMEGFKALFSSLSGIPKFAEGGMVTGMTMAVLGDNPSGKEFVIPYEKMSSFLSQHGTGGGDMRVEVVGKISGEDIYFSGLNYNNNRNKIIGG